MTTNFFQDRNRVSGAWLMERGGRLDLTGMVRCLSKCSSGCWQWVNRSWKGHRVDSGAFFGVYWRWEWIDGATGRAGEVYSRITLPIACCPDCGRDLHIAPNDEPRAIRRPVWPTIYSCRCGFFKGFKDEPEDVEAMVYQAIGWRTQHAAVRL
jgi:hypothetical protein